MHDVLATSLASSILVTCPIKSLRVLNPIQHPCNYGTHAHIVHHTSYIIHHISYIRTCARTLTHAHARANAHSCTYTTHTHTHRRLTYWIVFGLFISIESVSDRVFSWYVTCMCVCVCMCVCMCMSVCMCVCVCVCLCVYIASNYSFCLQQHKQHARTLTHAHIHVLTHTYTYVHTCTHAYICTHTCTHTYRIPFYYFLKLIFLIWCFMPQTRVCMCVCVSFICTHAYKHAHTAHTEPLIHTHTRTQ